MEQLNTTIAISNLLFKNPVTTASGTFGNGELMNRIYNVGELGAIFGKGTTLEPRAGNAPNRMVETASGMLNAVGLQNKGIKHFIEHIYPTATKLGTHIIVNANGSTISDYIQIAEQVNELDKIPALELNISCPNVKCGGMSFGVVPEIAKEVITAVRKVYSKPLFVKLTPNVTDITLMAKIAEDSGADAISLVNTFLGMAVDAHTRKPLLSTITGGLSGPCIKPIALRMVWQTFNSVKIPIIGIGGICNTNDALEFMLCGASLIQVGTYNFIDPMAPIKIIEGLKEYMKQNGISDLKSIIGALEV